VVNASSRHVAGVHTSARVRPPNKELFLIIPTHITNSLQHWTDKQF